MRYLILALVLATPLCADIVGRATFHDADTLTINDTRIRLFGVDAPELDQSCTDANGQPWACGTWALAQAQAMFTTSLTCKQQDTDRYGRVVAICHDADGRDIGESLVAIGAAMAYRTFSTAYVATEKSALISSLGIWQGDIQRPEDFRAAKAELAAAANLTQAPKDCKIKGNITENGHIYHLPGQEAYAKTVISTTKGERWFCSEAEAQAAGWRRARQ